MNVVLILEILKQKGEWTLAKASTSIEGVEQEIEINTFSHVEKGKLYTGDLKQEPYKGSYRKMQGTMVWKFYPKDELEKKPEAGGETKEPTKPLPTPDTQPPAAPSNLDVAVASGKITCLYLDKCKTSITLDDFLKTWETIHGQLRKLAGL